MDTFIIYPETPASVRVTRTALAELLSKGAIQPETLCVRESDGLMITVGEALGNAALAAKGISLSFPGASAGATFPPTPCAPKLGAQLPEGDPKEHAEAPQGDGPLLPKDRAYLLENGLVELRFAGQLTRSQGRAMVRRHRTRRRVRRFFKTVTVLAVLGAVVFLGMKYYGTEVRAWISKLTEKSDASQADQQDKAAFGKSTPKGMPPQAPQKSARFAGIQDLQDRVGVVYDISKAQRGPMAAFVGGGAVAQYGSGVYFFTPLSTLAKAAAPGCVLLDGRVLNLSELPMFQFGSLDLAAFYLGERAEWTDEDGKTRAALKIAQPSSKNYMEVRAASQSKAEFSPKLAVSSMGVSRREDGQWNSNKKINDAVVGAVLLNENGEMVGMIAQSDQRALSDELMGVNLAKLPSPAPVEWSNFLQQGKRFSLLPDRSESIYSLSLMRSGKDSLPDYAVRELVLATAKKVRVAQAKQTPSLRNTDKLMQLFKEQLAALSSVDAGGNYSVAFFEGQAALHARERARWMKDISPSMDRWLASEFQ